MPEPFEKKVWVEFEQVYLLTEENLSETAREEFVGRTPLTELIDRVYGSQPEARRVLRRPLHLNYEPSPLERTYLKIGAKRVKVLPPDEARLTLSKLNPLPLPAWTRTPSEAAAINPVGETLSELLKLIPTQGERYLNDRPVAAMIVGPNGARLATSLNSNSRIRTLHAERNLLTSLRANGHRSIPAGSTVLVSLKPCRMCAELLAASAQDIRSIQWIYSEDDPGPLAQNTCLDGLLVRRTTQ